MRPAAGCKAKIAAHVNKTSPRVLPIRLSMTHIKRRSCLHVRLGDLDVVGTCGIVNQTTRSASARPRQDQGPPRRGHAEPPPRGCHRAQLPPGGVLRSPGSRSGEVRDASPRAGGRRRSDAGRRRVRLLAADILRGTGELRGGGDRGARPEEAWPAWPPQAARRRDGAPRTADRRGPASPRARARPEAPGRTWSRGPSPNHRARCRCSKKKAGMIGTAPTTQGHSLESRYEALRGGALGQPVVPDARAGLTVLLRSGLWAWARALAMEWSPTRAASRDADSGPIEGPRDLIRLLADMTLASLRRNP